VLYTTAIKSQLKVGKNNEFLPPHSLCYNPSMRTQFEHSQTRLASRQLHVPGQRVFHFSSMLLIDVCPSHRKDAFWIGVGGQGFEPVTDLIMADALVDFIEIQRVPVIFSRAPNAPGLFDMSGKTLKRLEVPSTPIDRSPFPKISTSRSPLQKKGKWASLVYFIQSESGPIKIGYTTNLDARLYDLQASSPERLTTISCLPATLDFEKALHQNFKYCHSHLEWFYPDDLLVLFARSFRPLYPHLADRKIPEQRLSR
jgi:hypothetical protein